METENNVVEPKKKGSGLKIFLVILAIICSFAAGAGGLLLFFKLSPDFASQTVTNVTKTEKEVTVVDSGIADAVEKIYDSVVVVENYYGGSLYATGSGFVYKKEDNKYYLLTNHHVISGGQEIKVVFPNEKSYTVTVIGSDQYADIAVLELTTDSEIPVAEIGETENMRLGDTVFAIGSPVNSGVYSWSVTRGILSGKDREIAVKLNSSYTNDYIMHVIQTDAAINSGNSGGPLCNGNGEVVGLVNMKLKTTGVEGMGFGIPIEDAAKYADAVIKGEDVSRPQIGIYMADLTSSIMKQYDLPDDIQGVIVTGIDEGSPAEKSDLKIGDLILAINGTKVKSKAELKYQLYKYNPGDTISVSYYREGSEYKTNITLIKKS